MKKFKFSLEKLLEVREQELKQEKDHLAKLYGDKHTMEEQVKNLLIRFEDANKELVTTARAGISQQDWEMKKAFINLLSDEMNVLKYKISLMEKKIDAQMLVVVEASRNVKVIEKLKEKRLEQYHKEEEKAEEIFIEEFINSRRVL